MYKCIAYFTILIFILLPASAFSQGPRLNFKYINGEQGLSNSTIETIFQDSRGFIWFGTRDGLNCYDGYEMTVYRNNPEDTGSISDSYIRCIYEDRKHTLWIGTINGLNRFNANSNTFTRYKHDISNPKSLTNNYINYISEDKEGNLWICTYGGGIDRFDSKSQAFTHLAHTDNNNSLSDDHVNYLYEDTKGNIWVGTDKGLNLFNKKNKTFKVYSSNTRTPDVIELIQEDRRGNLWLGTEDKGLLLFNPEQKTFKQYQHIEKEPSSLANDQIRSLLIDRKGNLWIGSINGGLDLFNPNTDSFFHYQNEPDNPNSLSQRTVSALFEDNQQNLWVGTHRGGVNLYTPKADKFKLYRQESSPYSLSYNDVKAFYQDSEGNIWIGTDGGGLNLFNCKKNTFLHYRYNPFNAKSIGSDAVLDITEDSRNNFWIGTWGGGLNLFDRKTGTFKRFLNNPKDKNSISSDYVQKIFEDHRGNLWIATYYGGLNLFDRKTGKFSRFTKSPGNPTSLSGNNIVSINEDKNNNLWIGTDDGGLNCYNPNTLTFSHYFNEGEKMPDLRVIFTDSKGRLWIGQTGLYLFNPKHKTFNIYTHKAGLATEFIKGITEDEDGNFWIATSNGLTKFNPDTYASKKYNTADGLQGLEFEANAYLKTRDGEMFFGGINGFNSFYPHDIQINKFIPPVLITGFQIFNKKIIAGEKGSPLNKDISLTHEIPLSYKQSTFSFNFAALNYTAAKNNQYAYKLEGFDKDWNYIGNQRKASYTNLDPGEYIFRVKASNNDGTWNETGTSVKIIISPPFWKTWWFISFIAAVILGSAYAFLRFKRKLELRELEEKKREEMHQIQLQFFTNISHEFRTPLTLILGSLEKLVSESKPANLAHYHHVMFRNATRLMSLINELMDFRKVEAGALKLKVIPGDLSLFIDEIAEEFEDFATAKKISFIVKKTADIPEIWFDRQVLEKIILNLIHNSFKYTRDEGRIVLEILTSLDNFKPAYENELALKNNYRGKKYIYIRVADNGIGISKDSIHHLFQRYYRITESHLGSGVGLAFVKSLTFLHKGDIYVWSERHKGTEIIIAIPISREDYTNDERWIKTSEEGGITLESINYKHKYLLPPENENQPASAPTKHPAGSKHILIADDNKELRDFLKDTLGSLYRVSEATDGKSGLEKAKEALPDLIISDVMMPGLNGIEFCKSVKEDIETSHIPFLMLTAKDALESKIEGIESGADFYFEKPVSINLLLLSIRNIFEQGQKLKERYSKDYYLEARELVHSLKDKEFMDKLLHIIELQLVNPELDVDYLCTEIGMSRTKLYQKIKQITGQSIGEFIRTIRLKKAVQIMTHEDVLLTEVMYRVGIQTQSYFTKAFKKEFGKTPSQFLNEVKQQVV